MYSDDDVAALYDRLNPWEPSDDFYLSYVLEAGSVLDVGCGTGRLLHRAREAGHGGRLCGLDPDPASLARARRRADVEWVEGRAADMTWEREFDLAVMASNVFQVFVTDDELAASLAATRSALVDGGRLVFGTRNPRVRAWEGWTPASPIDVVDHHGRELRVVYQVESVAGGVVTLTETTATRDGRGAAGRPGQPAVPRRRRGRGGPGPRRLRGRGPGTATGRGDRSPRTAATSWWSPARGPEGSSRPGGLPICTI